MNKYAIMINSYEESPHRKGAVFFTFELCPLLRASAMKSLFGYPYYNLLTQKIKPRGVTEFWRGVISLFIFRVYKKYNPSCEVIRGRYEE